MTFGENVCNIKPSETVGICDEVFNEVSGHAHGGQVRIPGLVNGLFSPGEQWFPKYAGGEYRVEETLLIVSRGLSRESTAMPRIWNRPETVVIELQPTRP